MKENNISIIIPTLNEAINIKYLLLHLLQNSATINISEIIIVDCGSTDDTQKIVGKFSLINHKIKLILSEKGRAKQMNKGAKIAVGNILYFLHADSLPPKDFDLYILNEVKTGNSAGCFKMKFDSNHWWLKFTGWLTQFNWRASRGGDQSQFITKKLFNDIGCFNEQFTVYEDNDLINKLYARKEFVVIQKWLTTSARRYKNNGVWKLQYHFCMIYFKKWTGASAENLYDYYKKNIKE
jgi:rSAM/selenodomain-associated transferase 2